MKKVIATLNAPGAIGPYSQAIDTGTYQLRILRRPGVGILLEGTETAYRQAIANAAAILNEAGLSLDNVVKTTVYLHDMGDFQAMNEVYAECFSAPFPARSAVAVKELPKKVLVEVEVLAVR